MKSGSGEQTKTGSRYVAVVNLKTSLFVVVHIGTTILTNQLSDLSGRKQNLAELKVKLLINCWSNEDERREVAQSPILSRLSHCPDSGGEGMNQWFLTTAKRFLKFSEPPSTRTER